MQGIARGFRNANRSTSIHCATYDICLDIRFYHKTGGQALKFWGKIIQSHVRGSDIPCHFEGDEFVIVMPEATLEIAKQRADQIRTNFRSMKFFDEKDPLVPMLSIGVAAFPDHDGNLESILNSADQAMYPAKAVRNIIVIYWEKLSQKQGLPTVH